MTEPTKPTGIVLNAEVYRLIEVDFEARTLTLRALGQRQTSFASGNYVVIPQEEFVALRKAQTGEVK